MKHLQLEDFHKDNLKYYVAEPDKNFRPEKNYAVIADTIKEYEKTRYGIDPKVQENAGNAADILASFAKYKLDGSDGGKTLEQWLGKYWISKIYGEKLIEKVKMAKTIEKMNRQRGNDKFLNYYLT